MIYLSNKAKSASGFIFRHLYKIALKRAHDNKKIYFERKFNYAIKMYEKKQKEGIISLSDTFDELNLGSENFSKDFINQLLLLASKNSSLILPSETDVITFLQETTKINHRNIQPYELLLLNYILISHGLFRAGYIIREKAIDSAFINSSSSSSNLKYLQAALTASFDNHDIVKSNELIQITSNLCSEEELNDYIFYNNMLKYSSPSSLILPLHKFEKQDYEYLELIKGRSVAVAGPAQAVCNNVNEINSHDIVVQMNYYGNEESPDKQQYVRADISYYNKQIGQIIDARSRDDFLYELCFSSFKTINHRTQNDLLSSNRGRLFFQMNSLLFNGRANILQNALFDLLNFNPKSINLYNVNFFLSQNAYQKGYQQEKYQNRPPCWRWRSFAGHDIMTQINFTRSLWRAGKIAIDEPCKSVLELDSFSYMAKMEGIWVNSAVTNFINSRS